MVCNQKRFDMRRSGKTTKMLVDIAQYIVNQNFNKEKKYIILASHSVVYSMELAERLYAFFPNATRFAYTSFTIGNVVIRTFNHTDLHKSEVMRGIKWDRIFQDHYHGEL